MKINFKVPLLVFDEEAKDQDGNVVYINKTLANLLGGNPHKDTGISYMDAIDWAIAINKGEDIDLEKSEQAALKKFIEDDSSLTAFAKASLMGCFKDGGDTK